MRPLAFALFLCLFSLPVLGQSTIWVTDLVDDTDENNGSCNLREALEAAKTNSTVDECIAGTGADEIRFTKTGRIELIEELATTTESVSIIGPGPDLLTIDANRFGRVLDFLSNGSSTYNISGLTITNGLSTLAGGGIRVSVFGGGGVPILNIDNCIITGNEAFQGGGVSISSGILNIDRTEVSDNVATTIGGGIRASGDGFTLQNSTISGNESTDGGGIYALVSFNDEIVIERSTISNNTAYVYGGGINFVGLGKLRLSHSTIISNTAGASTEFGDGGGLKFSGPMLFIKNNIIADNEDLGTSDAHHPDLFYLASTSPVTYGYNLIGERSSVGSHPVAGNPNADGDYVGTSASPILANVGPLQDNGGPTMTHAPDPGLADPINTVIDKGSCTSETDFEAQAYDQKGVGTDTGRAFDFSNLSDADDSCDIGAFEWGPIVASKFSLKVLLDGPYTNVLMGTGLNMAGLLPSSQPYNTAPWNYSGFEGITSISADMVDWILVDLLRGGLDDASGLEVVATKAFILNDNGDVVLPDLNEPKYFVDPGNYYIRIRHRNHLSVTSALPVFLKWSDTTPAIDFRRDLSEAFSGGGLALRDRGSSYYTMWAGDGNANASVSAFDFLSVWLPANGSPPAYSIADFDLDGSTSAFDFLNAWLPANGQASQIP